MTFLEQLTEILHREEGEVLALYDDHLGKKPAGCSRRMAICSMRRSVHLSARSKAMPGLSKTFRPVSMMRGGCTLTWTITPRRSAS